MFERYFNLRENPFTIAPNPRYLYLSDRHREALAHLNYGLRENGGCILLTGEVGAGKTTVCRCLLESLPEDVSIAFILHPPLGELELLQAVCGEFGIAYAPQSNARELTDQLNKHLLALHAKGRRAVVIVEEAQRLPIDVLERLRLLTNLETSEHKLLQLILIGQPELRDTLARPELQQFAQRIVARYHLGPLNFEEVRAYLAHRIKVAGGDPEILPPAAQLRIAQLSRGVPRVINLLCDRALLGCYARDQRRPDPRMIDEAAREVFGEPAPAPRRRRLAAAVAAGFGIVAAAAAAATYWQWDGHSAPAQAALVAPPAAPATVAHAAAPSAPRAPAEAGAEFGAGDTAAEPAVGPATDPAAATGAEPAPAAPAAPAPLAWADARKAGRSGLGDGGGGFSQAAAYRALFDLWDLDYSAAPAAPPCEFAADNQLDCWHADGDFNELTKINRPALVKLLGDDGRPFYGALVGVARDGLHLSIGGRPVRVARDEFKRAWTGERVVLWRRPAGFRGALRPGDRGIVVDWLARRLDAVEARAPTGAERYDRKLIRRVRAFQRRCDLQVDGLAGHKTLIMLNMLEGGTPRLREDARVCGRKVV